MSITARNERLIAYKKLVGKTHTSSQKGASGEFIPSSVQSSTPEIFANTPVYDADSPKFCQKVIYQLTAVPGSQYEATTSGTEAQGETMIGLTQQNVEHAFALVLNEDDALQTNTKKQLVSPSFGINFKAKVFDNQGNQLAEDGTQDWSIDYYSGVLFMQDMGGVTPATVEAYLYTGKYVSDVIAEVQDNEDTLLKGVVDRLDVGIGNAPPTFNKVENINPTVARFDGNAGITGDLEVQGVLHTKQLIVEETTKVVEKSAYQGIAEFGNPDSVTNANYKDTFTFYGDVKVSGSIEASDGGAGRLKVKYLTRSDFIQNQSDEPLEYEIGGDDKKINLFLISSLDQDSDSEDDSYIYLPPLFNDSTENGLQYVFKHLCGEGHIIKIQPKGSNKLDGSNYGVTLYAQYESVTVVAYDGNWYIV